MKKIAILGSTGSIGKNLINILKKDKNNFKIELLTANKNYKELIKQTKIFNVKNIIITNKNSFIIIKKIFKNKKINIYDNYNSFKKIFNNKKIDYTMSAISGFDGVEPTINIIKFSKKIAIANKEAIICGWSLINTELKKNKTEFIPVDSEHFSIWSLINNIKISNIEKIFITASGGPFINYPLNRFKHISKNLALNHPNWAMGPKISVDSATMMNKVFEVIEAKKIFNISYNKLNILLHPSSYVHAIVKFSNGLNKILIHDTNMKIPIFNSLYSNYEKKIITKSLDFKKINDLKFSNINQKRYPATKILNNLSEIDSLYETIIVVINDFYVSLFLAEKIRFNEISKFTLKALNRPEFTKYKKVKLKNVNEINKLKDYVLYKIQSFSI